MKTIKIIAIVCVMLGFAQAQADPSISGYYNFEHFDYDKDGGKDDKYDMHHFNLMIGHEVDDFRVFAEIEFEHSPKHTDTASRGTITTERAWGEWNPSKYFNLRMGLMLNGTLYQQNHYPSVVVNMSRPQIVRNVFDADVEGIRAFGDLGYGFNYEVEHGQEPKGASETQIGYALGYHRDYGDIEVGLTGRSHTYNIAATDEDEVSTGVEFMINAYDFTLWAETGTRKIDGDNNDIKGTYAIASYRFEIANWGEIYPSVMYDSYEDEAAQNGAKVRTGIGVTYKPNPAIAVKIESLSTAKYDNDSDVEQDSASQLGFGFIYFYN